MSNNALVLWSGGLDSTLVLYDLLEKKEGMIRSLAIYCDQIGGYKQMAKARQKLITWFDKKFGKHRFTHSEVTLSGTNIYSNGGLAQPPMWVTLGALELKHSEDLYVGWIRADDVWHYRNHVYEMFKTTANVLLHKESTLQTPLEWCSKNEVIARAKDAGFYHLTRWCESNKSKPCGECTPCITHNTYLQLYNENVKKLEVKQ